MQLIDNLRVAKPCPASWSEMEGDDRTRYCALCKHNVHNISEMSREEAEEFLRSVKGRTCVRLYQREDGKVMTKDCPRGVAQARRKLALAFVTVLAAGISAASVATMKPIPKEKFESVKRDVEDSRFVRFFLDKINPQPAPPPIVTMGMVACPPSTPPAKGP